MEHIGSFNEVPDWLVFDISNRSDRVVQKPIGRAGREQRPGVEQANIEDAENQVKKSDSPYHSTNQIAVHHAWFLKCLNSFF